MIARALVAALALAGLADALYFTFAYYGRVKKARWVPEALCAKQGSSCLAVVRTPYASVFGVPNSLPGILYYALLIAWAAAGQGMGLEFSVGMHSFLILFRDLLLAAGAAAVALGFYLIFALRRILHADCPLCYAAHAINLVLLALLAFMG